MRIDIDAEESVHHVKADNMEEFGLFLEQLQQHRHCHLPTVPTRLADPEQFDADPDGRYYFAYPDSIYFSIVVIFSFLHILPPYKKIGTNQWEEVTYIVVLFVIKSEMQIF